MKATLIAAGGLLFASAAFATAMAVPATAAATSYPQCVFDLEFDGSFVKTDDDDITVGTGRLDVCKRLAKLGNHNDDFWD